MTVLLLLTLPVSFSMAGPAKVEALPHPPGCPLVRVAVAHGKGVAAACVAQTGLVRVLHGPECVCMSVRDHEVASKGLSPTHDSSMCKSGI